MASLRSTILPARFGIVALALLAVLAVAPPPSTHTKHAIVHPAVAAAVPIPLPSPEDVLRQIRKVFRSHRPPPPYETYTLVRKQMTTQGYPDYPNTYTVHIWCRTSDRAALERKVYRDDYRGDMTFDRPAFNEDRDPGPPTADLFEKAPVHPNPVSFVPTPEPSGTEPPVIGSVRVVGETDYKATKAVLEGNLIHVSVVPFRDTERNRLREIYVDAKTYELRKIVSTDRLFVTGDVNSIYGVTFTVTLEQLDGIPVVTYIYGVVGDGYNDDGKTVEYWFKDIKFPQSLPDWYFDPHQYAQHRSDAPS
jgi:hypothetical protein